MRSKDLELKIKDAAGRVCPNALDGILERCGQGGPNIYVLQAQRPRRRFAPALAAAALALVFSGIFAANWLVNRRVDARVMLDVNPSIELKVNRNNRVIEAGAKNADAVTILDNMDLRNTPVDVAVNALIGSMLKYGYIEENANSVLLSVESPDGEKSAVLQKELAQSISLQLNRLNGAVLSQNLTGDEALRRLADAYGISYGKAALVQKILNENSHLLFADLAGLPVNDLNLLVSSKNIEAEGMEARGRASGTAYIDEATAKETALRHAGISEAEAGRLRVELDYDDGHMVYDVEFYHGGWEYEYEINASDAAVIESGREGRESGESPRTAPAPEAQDASAFIGEERAAEIVRAYAGLAADTRIKAEMDKDDGVYIYELEFETEGKEYSCEVNATTGEILSWDEDD